MSGTKSLLAATIAIALAAPAAFAQVSVGGQAGVQVQTPPMSAQVPPSTMPTMPAPQTPATPSVPPAPPMPTMPATLPAQPVDQASGAVAGTVQGTTRAGVGASAADQDLWMRLDANHDGRVSLDEAKGDAGFGVRFKAVDSNGDGFVSSAEYAAGAATDGARDAAGAATGAARDTTGAVMGGTQAAADEAKRTGSAAVQETGQAATHAAQDVGKAAAHAGHDAGKAAAHAGMASQATFRKLDADRDGKVSAAEAGADAGFNGGFSAMDADGDGFVTDAEFRAHAKASSKPAGHGRHGK